MSDSAHTTLARANCMSLAPGRPGARPWMGWVLGLAVASALLGTAWQRYAGEPLSDEAAPAQWQRSLHFEDRPNGDIAVVDAVSRHEVARFQGEQGFVRGALRALARERRRFSMGPEQPFELTGHVDGRLTLRDPATGMRLNLESFGPTNAGVFSRLRSATPAALAAAVSQGKS
jgi:putative photosynthetic complex assembly protein